MVPAGGKVGAAELSRQRAARAWSLRCQGRTHQQIADDLGVTRQAVAKMLERESDRYLKECGADVARHKAAQDAILNETLSALLESWRSSLPAPGGPPASPHSRNPWGDPRYVEQARGVLADLRKLWGLDAPVRTQSEVTGKDGSALNPPPAPPTDAELAAALDMLARKAAGMQDGPGAEEAPAP